MDHSELTAEELEAALMSYGQEKGSTDVCIELIHRQLPASKTEEFNNLVENQSSIRIEIPEVKVILVRDVSVPTLANVHLCEQCAMRRLICASGGYAHPDGKYREMPCESDRISRHPFKAYKMVDASVQSHRKMNGRKEYIPDTPDSFDIKGTWNSVRTMIGMG